MATGVEGLPEQPTAPLGRVCLGDKDSFRKMPHVELRHLRYVVTLAEELNFGRAAARLNMTQPPLSQQIRLLEEQLGVTLFHRSKRHVRLTEAGSILATEGRRILAETEQAVRQVVKASHGEVGILRLGSINSADCIVVKTLKAFARHTPQVQFELQSMTTSAQLEAIHTGRIQAGFFRLPASDPKLTIVPLLKESLILALPRSHKLSSEERLPLAALANEQFILASRAADPGLYDSIIAACRAAGFAPRVTYETGDVYASLRIVEAGLGISMLPSLRHFQRPEIVLRQIESPAPQTEMAVAYSGDNTSELLRHFLSVLREIAESVQVVVDKEAQAPFDDVPQPSVGSRSSAILMGTRERSHV